MELKITDRIILIIFALLCCILFSFSSCGNFTEPDPATIVNEILNSVEFPEMLPVSLQNLNSHIEFDTEALISNMSFYISKTESNADEVGVFKLKDNANITQVVDAIAAHLKQREQGFKNVDQAGYDKIQKSVLTSNNGYVLVVVCNSPEIANQIFNDMVRGNSSGKKGLSTVNIPY